MKAGTRVSVEWEDAYADSGWVAEEKINHEPAIVETLGIVHFHDKRGLYLVQTKIENFTSGRFFIPNGMIRKIKVIK